MGGKSGAAGHNLELAVIRDVLVEGLIREQTGRSIDSWLLPEPLIDVTHQKRLSIGQDVVVDGDVVLELEGGVRVWIEAKKNARVASVPVREDVAKMWRQFVGQSNPPNFIYVLTTNAGSRSSRGWETLRDDLDAHRAGAGDSSSILEQLGIVPVSEETSAATFLRQLRVWLCQDDLRVVSQRLASALWVEMRDADLIRDTLISLPVLSGGRFHPIVLSHMLGELRQRGLLLSLPAIAKRAVKRVRLASERTSGLSSLHPKHEGWKIDRRAILDRIGQVIDKRDVVVEGVSGAGKSVLVRSLVAECPKNHALILSGESYRATCETWTTPWDGAGPADLLAALMQDGLRMLVVDGVDELAGNQRPGVREVIQSARVTQGLRVLLALRPESVAAFTSAAERRFESIEIPELSESEIQDVIERFPDAQLGFLREPAANGLLRLARRPFLLSLLVRMRVAAVEPSALCNPDRLPTEEELIVRVWRHFLVEHADPKTRDEDTALRLAAELLTSPIVRCGSINRNLSVLRDAGIIGHCSEQLEFTHRGFHELATGLALAQDHARSAYTLESWLTSVSDPLVRIGVVRSLVAYVLHAGPERAGALLRRLVHPGLTRGARIDAVGSAGRNVTALTAGTVMITIASLPGEIQAEILEWFLRERTYRVLGGSLEPATNAEILRELGPLLRQAPRERQQDLAVVFLEFSEALATATPKGQLNAIAATLTQFFAHLESWAADTSDQTLGRIRDRLIRSVLHLYESDIGKFLVWAREDLGDPAFAQSVLTELAEFIPTDLRGTLVIWEAASVALHPGRESENARRLLERLLEMVPGPATAAAVRLLTLHLPGSDDSECAEDSSLAMAGPFTRSYDAWNFPATLLANAWNRWASKEGVPQGRFKKNEERLNESLGSMEQKAKTVLPRALVLETIANLTDGKAAVPEALIHAARTILGNPAWVARLSMGPAAGEALFGLLRRPDLNPDGIAQARRLLEVAGTWTGRERSNLLGVLARLSDHPVPDVRYLGRQARELGGRPLEPPRVTSWSGVPGTRKLFGHMDRAQGIATDSDAYEEVLPVRTTLFDARSAQDKSVARKARSALTAAWPGITAERDKPLRLAIERELAGECEQIAGSWQDAAAVDKAWVLTVLLRLADSEDPLDQPPLRDSLATVSPAARAACARSLAALDVEAGLDKTLPASGLTSAERLLIDSNPAVRVEAVRALPRYEKRRADWMWRSASEVVFRETGEHAGHILYWLACGLRYAIRRNAERARPLLNELLDCASSTLADKSWTELRREAVRMLAVVAIETGGGLWDDLDALVQASHGPDLGAVAEIAVPWQQAKEEAQRGRALRILEGTLRCSTPESLSAAQAVALAVARGESLENTTWERLGIVLSRQVLDRETRRAAVIAADTLTMTLPVRSIDILEGLCKKRAEELDFAAPWDQARFTRKVLELLFSIASKTPDLRARAADCVDRIRPLAPVEAGQILERLRNLE